MNPTAVFAGGEDSDEKQQRRLTRDSWNGIPLRLGQGRSGVASIQCAVSSDDLSVRSADCIGAADRPLRAGAAQPHAGPFLLAKATPAEHFINWQQDPQGKSTWPAWSSPKKTLTGSEVNADLVADITSVINLLDFFLVPEAEHWLFAYDPRSPMKSAPSAKFFLDSAGATAKAGLARYGRPQPPAKVTIDSSSSA